MRWRLHTSSCYISTSCQTSTNSYRIRYPDRPGYVHLPWIEETELGSETFPHSDHVDFPGSRQHALQGLHSCLNIAQRSFWHLVLRFSADVYPLYICTIISTLYIKLVLDNGVKLELT